MSLSRLQWRRFWRRLRQCWMGFESTESVDLQVQRDRNSREPTVDPSSTTISSKSWNVCRQTLEIARRNSSGRL